MNGLNKISKKNRAQKEIKKKRPEDDLTELINRSGQKRKKTTPRQELRCEFLKACQSISSEIQACLSDEQWVLVADTVEALADGLEVKFLEVETVPKELPQKAPRIYQGHKCDGPICKFLQEVYGEWLDGISMARADLEKLDPSAYEALRNWLRSPKNNLQNSGLAFANLVESRMARERVAGKLASELSPEALRRMSHRKIRNRP